MSARGFQHQFFSLELAKQQSGLESLWTDISDRHRLPLPVPWLPAIRDQRV
jgi:hypothetical protein